MLATKESNAATTSAPHIHPEPNSASHMVSRYRLQQTGYFVLSLGGFGSSGRGDAGASEVLSAISPQ